MAKQQINCIGCNSQLSCAKIAKDGGFKYWGCMQKYLTSDKRPYVLLKAMTKEIKRFIPEYSFFWSGNCFLCKAPYGSYIWHFAVWMKQETIWQYPEFTEGYEFGFNPKEPFRDANPYQESSRNMSWDTGYILGLHSRPGEKDDGAN